jgi:hypothetical protein
VERANHAQYGVLVGLVGDAEGRECVVSRDRGSWGVAGRVRQFFEWDESGAYE